MTRPRTPNEAATLTAHITGEKPGYLGGASTDWPRLAALIAAKARWPFETEAEAAAFIASSDPAAGLTIEPSAETDAFRAELAACRA